MGLVVIQPLILVSMLKKTKTRFLRFSGSLNSIKTYEARIVVNISFCTTTELSIVLTSCFTAIKNMLLSTAKKYMKDPVRIYLSLLRIQVKH